MFTTAIVGGILGGLGGLGAVNVMALIAKNGPKHHDTVQFTSQDSIWPKVDGWAQRHGYALKNDGGATRRYQKGKNLLTAPVLLEAAQQGNQASIKAYIQINGFIVKGDMPLSGGGFMAKVPRAMGKKAVNELLRELGQPELA